MQGRKLVASKPCKHMPSNSWIPGSAREARKRLYDCHTRRYLKTKVNGGQPVPTHGAWGC